MAQATDNQIYCYSSICQLILSKKQSDKKLFVAEKEGFIEISTTQTSKVSEEIIKHKRFLLMTTPLNCLSRFLHNTEEYQLLIYTQKTFARIVNWKPIIQIRQEIMWHKGIYYFVI